MSTTPDPNHARALELHLAGATYETIADQLGYASKGYAHEIVQTALAALTMPEMSAEHKSTSMARLDAMLVGIWPKARRGDVAAIDRVLKIEERRMALLAFESGVATPAPKETGLSEFEKRLRDREQPAKNPRRAKHG